MKYEKPILFIELFDTEELITTSLINNGAEGNGGPGFGGLR